MHYRPFNSFTMSHMNSIYQKQYVFTLPSAYLSLNLSMDNQPPFPTMTLPTTFFDTLLELTALNILGYYFINTFNGLQEQILVQWDSQPESDATWENLSHFHFSYPNFNLKDKVNSHRLGNDTQKAQPRR